MDIYLPRQIDRKYFLELLSQIEAIKSFDVDMIKDQDMITIVIKKFGETRLGFRESVEGSQVKYTLVEENMAIFHKPFRSKIIEGLADVLKGIGGRVEF